MIHTCIERK